jgi:hypothetical protein
VRLTIDLDVRGGWLSEFEIAGLEPGSTLDPDKPVWLVHAGGHKVSPRAELRPDGVLVLRFSKPDAPRRGRHRLGVTYWTRLSLAEKASGKRRMQFNLPAWRVDLEAVDIWVNAPAQASWPPAEDPAMDGVVTRELHPRGQRTILRAHRVSLPRTLAFGVEFELPVTAASAEPKGSFASNAASAPLGLGVAVALLAWLKHRSVLARAARRGRRPLALLPLGNGLRALLMAALAIGGALCYPHSAALGLTGFAGSVALALYRHVGHVRPERRAGARRRLAHAADLLGAASWLDATTPAGLALLASAYTLAALRIALGGPLGPWLELLLLVTPLWLTGTRLHAAQDPRGAADADCVTPLRAAAAAIPRAPDRAA